MRMGWTVRNQGRELEGVKPDPVTRLESPYPVVPEGRLPWNVSVT